MDRGVRGSPRAALSSASSAALRTTYTEPALADVALLAAAALSSASYSAQSKAFTRAGIGPSGEPRR